MPVPLEYSRARDDFYAFILDVRDSAGLGSSHQTYTMVQGVLHAYRRRLTLQQGIRFCNALPVGLRALFVADWDVEEPMRAFGDDATMLLEARSLRHQHNFAPETAIDDVVRAVWRHVDIPRFEAALALLPKEAQMFWKR